MTPELKAHAQEPQGKGSLAWLVAGPAASRRRFVLRQVGEDQAPPLNPKSLKQIFEMKNLPVHSRLTLR